MRQRRRPPSRYPKFEKRPRINEQITAPTVLLVSGDGAAETMSSIDALARAREQELDLIEIAPKASPPVVKIGDVGHYLYQAQKKEKKQRSHSKQSEVKMLRFGFRTDRHDIERLLLRAREFFSEKHSVKFVVRMRGRELSNKEYAAQKLRTAIATLQDVADIDQEMKLQGNQFLVVLCPRKGGKNALPEGPALR